MNRLSRFACLGIVLLPLGWMAAQHAEPASSPDRRLSGIVMPRHQVELKAPQDGVLKTLHVEEGEPVRKGEKVALMEHGVQEALTLIAAIRARDTSEMDARQLTLMEREIRLGQMQELYTAKAAQEWELRQALVQRDLAKAEFAAAKVQHQLNQENLVAEQRRLKLYTLNAPFPGRVVRISVDEGATLRLNDPILLLVDLSRLKAELHLPVELFGKIKIGQAYRFDAEAPVNRRVSGRLKHMEPLIDPASKTFRCVFEIDNPDEKLPSGFSVRLIWPQP